jgi:putative transcriptional regulator
MKNLIKVERARKNITQADLAEVIGVSRQTIHAIETGKFIPSTLLTMKMAHYFGCNVEDIFELEEKDLKNEQD